MLRAAQHVDLSQTTGPKVWSVRATNASDHRSEQDLPAAAVGAVEPTV